MRALALLAFVACLSWSHGAADCTFSIPSVDDPTECVTYTDLPTLVSQGPYKVSTPDYDYIFNLCGDVNSSSLPQQCASVSPAVAYQYNNKSCYSLGKNDNSSKYMYSIDPLYSDKGIRLAYDNGDNGSAAIWPRAIIFDLVCDEKATTGKPLTVEEFPSYTYTVRWPSSAACNVKSAKGSCPVRRFDETWDSLRFRPRPSWFDDAKFGIFIHWGVFSVPSFKTEWYWKRLMEGEADFVNFHNRVYGCSGVMPDKYPCEGPSFSYADFAPMFKAEMYDPDEWADLFKRAGAKYVVLTSKHHEGWCNFPSAYHWNWNSMDVGPAQDLTGNLTNSVRAAGLHMGLYHSLREWFNPVYIKDNEDNCSTTTFVDEVLHPTLKEIVENYKPEVIWADGAGDAKCTHDSINYWKAPKFLSWLYNDSPVKNTVVANSRWGSPTIGDYQTGGDRFTPGMILPYKWESCYTIQKSSWGYDRTEGLENFLNASDLIKQLVSTVSCNGNLLLNVGPTADGRILPTFAERLLQIGSWLEINGEAIYNSTPWRAQNDTAEKQTWYTASKDGKSVYAITLAEPVPGGDVVLKQPVASNSTQVTLLGYSDSPLKFTKETDGLHITFPMLPYNTTLRYAWTFKLMGVA